MLALIANLAHQASEVSIEAEGELLFASHPDLPAQARQGRLPPWSVLWLLAPRAA
jgi:hypothetical protein